MLGYWQIRRPPRPLRDGVAAHRRPRPRRRDRAGLHHRPAQLVIVRGGANVYPAEVERIIDSCAGVVAAAFSHPRRPSRLPRRGRRAGQPGVAGVDLIGLQEHCLGLLARYKVPERWRITTEQLPRNAMGKIDRQRLAATFGPERLSPAPTSASRISATSYLRLSMSSRIGCVRENRGAGRPAERRHSQRPSTRGDVRMAEHLIEREHWRRRTRQGRREPPPTRPAAAGRRSRRTSPSIWASDCDPSAPEIGAVQIEALQQGGVELRLDRAHRDKASVGALVGVIEGAAPSRRFCSRSSIHSPAWSSVHTICSSRDPPSIIAASTTWPGARARGFPDRGEDADDEQHRTSAIVTDQVQRRKGRSPRLPIAFSAPVSEM